MGPRDLTQKTYHLDALPFHTLRISGSAALKHRINGLTVFINEAFNCSVEDRFLVLPQ
jgi:hypothetical protein